VFDVGMGEFLVIALVAVLVFGPDRLPRALAQGMGWVRALRDQAANARREIMDAADLDPTITDDIKRSMSDLADLHPRRLASSILTDVPDERPARTDRPAPAPGAAPSFDPDAT
jgi:sec-independent protein translocase protein TatB